MTISVTRVGQDQILISQGEDHMILDESEAQSLVSQLSTEVSKGPAQRHLAAHGVMKLPD